MQRTCCNLLTAPSYWSGSRELDNGTYDTFGQKGCEDIPGNCRVIGPTSEVGKPSEAIFREQKYGQKFQLKKQNHGFLQGKSLTNLIECFMG